MKATKLKENTKTILRFLLAITIAVTVLSCDVLDSDPDVLQPDTDITGKEIYVLANSPSFIDLNTALQSNTVSRVTITSEARHGKITDLGKGILQYAPSIGNSRGRDGFQFTVYAQNNEVIKRDSVIIFIENDSTNLPCNIYPATDYVYGVDQVPVVIDVTSNDVICGGKVVVSIFKPENSFPPYFGQAEVTNNKIKYTPGPAFKGEDKIMYKLTVSGDSARSAYGLVYIKGDSACNFRLTNYQYVFNDYAIDSLVTLPVFINDSLCHALNQYQVNLKSSPVYGQASLLPNGFSYKFPANVNAPFADHFTYEVCMDATCKTARIDVHLKKDSVIACALVARMDSINIAYDDDPQIYIDVLQNDSICGNLKSLKITEQPLYGISVVNNYQISYKKDAQQEKDDTLEYEICTSEGCSRARVLIKRTK